MSAKRVAQEKVSEELLQEGRFSDIVAERKMNKNFEVNG